MRVLIKKPPQDLMKTHVQKDFFLQAQYQHKTPQSWWSWVHVLYFLVTYEMHIPQSPWTTEQWERNGKAECICDAESYSSSQSISMVKVQKIPKSYTINTCLALKPPLPKFAWNEREWVRLKKLAQGPSPSWEREVYPDSQVVPGQRIQQHWTVWCSSSPDAGLCVQQALRLP